MSFTLAGHAHGLHVHDAHRPHSGHATSAPIGVMGDHLHPQGDWMIFYRLNLGISAPTGSINAYADGRRAELKRDIRQEFLV